MDYKMLCDYCAVRKVCRERLLSNGCDHDVAVPRCKNCEFCESIVENGASLYKREAGCQATYMPYSGLDIKSFATAFVRALIGGNFERNKNYHFRWIGALSQAERYGIRISSAAQGLQEFTSYVERID